MIQSTRDPRDREALLHLASGRHSAASLARVLGVSRITAFRLIQELRRRGIRVVSVKRGAAWFFELEESAPPWDADPLVRMVGFARGRRRPGESVDDAVYGRRP
jgi:biotin operon repressor